MDHQPSVGCEHLIHMIKEEDSLPLSLEVVHLDTQHNGASPLHNFLLNHMYLSYFYKISENSVKKYRLSCICEQNYFYFARVFQPLLRF